MFGKKLTVGEQTKAHNRELRQTDRELLRDRHKLDAEEQRLTNDIRKAAATGNKQAVGILAKQLAKIRNQKGKSLEASGHIQGLTTQNTIMASNIHTANAMKGTANTIAKMNKIMNPEEVSKITQQFTQEHTKFTITDDLIGETLEAAFAQEGDSEEEDAIVNQVLDEIGISLNEKMANAPRVPGAVSHATVKARQKNDEDAEIDQILSNLKA